MARNGFITSQEDLVGTYGPTWRQGVLSEHLRLWQGEVKHLAGGSKFVVADDGRAYPVVCSELVEILTEDGQITGRCGALVVNDSPFCSRHEVTEADFDSYAEERDYYGY